MTNDVNYSIPFCRVLCSLGWTYWHFRIKVLLLRSVNGEHSFGSLENNVIYPHCMRKVVTEINNSQWCGNRQNVQLEGPRVVVVHAAAAAAEATTTRRFCSTVIGTPAQQLLSRQSLCKCFLMTCTRMQHLLNNFRAELTSSASVNTARSASRSLRANKSIAEWHLCATGQRRHLFG